MSSILLTQSGGSILGPIAKAIGVIINFIYVALSNTFGIENVGFTIIIFTIVVYMILFPFTYKQQKFSRLNMKMSPELKAVQKKYEGKTDQQSRIAMSQETQAIYDKYGVSPTGSCLPMLIQFPILLAVYRVVYNIPAYVSSVKDVYGTVVSDIVSVNGYDKAIKNIVSDLNIKRLSLNFDGSEKEAANSVIDAISKFTDSGWNALVDNFPQFSDHINSLHKTVAHFNDFLGLDISYSPFESVKMFMPEGKFVLVIIAILLPIVSGLSQWLSMKLTMATQDPTSMKENPAMQQMKAMNTFMPFFSVILVFTSPIGLGLYWITSAVVRCIQQFFLNKHFDKLNFDEIIEKNRDKAEAKQAKRAGYVKEAISQNGKLSTRNVNSSNTSNEEALKEAESLKANAKKGSLTSKANLVKDFNNRNNN